MAELPIHRSKLKYSRDPKIPFVNSRFKVNTFWPKLQSDFDYLEKIDC